MNKSLHDFSSHFSFYELTDSKKHPSLVVPNRAYAMRYIENGFNLSWLLNDIKMFVFYGDIMDTSSGCRSIYLNTAVGGYDKIIDGKRVLSSHCRFVAWDGKPRKYSVDLAFKMIMDAQKKGELPTLGKVIIEKIGSKEWLHIQVKERLNQVVLFLSTSDGVNYKTIHKG